MKFSILFCVVHDAIIESDSNDTINEHGILQRRGLTCPVVTPIPDLRPGLDSPTSSAASNKPPFQGLSLFTNQSTTINLPTPYSICHFLSILVLCCIELEFSVLFFFLFSLIQQTFQSFSYICNSLNLFSCECLTLFLFDQFRIIARHFFRFYHTKTQINTI